MRPGALTVVSPSAPVLAAAAAGRLLSSLADAQAQRGVASVALTGGGIGTALLQAVAVSPARDSVDWRAVDVWWSDERWLAPGDADRNEVQARSALLDQLDLDAARVHPMGADTGSTSVEDAASDYARQLTLAYGVDVSLDVILLGVGPDAHVASLFPEHPGLQVEDRSVVAVLGSPKPPPLRISLTLPTINAAREVWLLAAGEAKADAVALAFSGAGVHRAPAAGVSGRQRTLWLLDAAATERLPRGH